MPQSNHFPDSRAELAAQATPRPATIRTRRGGKYVSEVKIADHDNFETALKRFNRKIQQDGILGEARRRAHYEKPSVKRKKKAAARQRKSRKSEKR